MAIGLIGRKCGMTRVFDADSGASTAVTVLKIEPHRITQWLTQEKHGYTAIQVTAGEKERRKLNKPELGHFAKVGVEEAEKKKKKKKKKKVNNVDTTA